MCEQSSSIESVLQKMQSSLACTICLDLLDSPMTTKCGHTFCKVCLDRLLQSSRSSVPCPLCITTAITRRSAKQNKKIASLVNAVRNVISSIKKDCGVQEPVKTQCTLSSTSAIANEETELEEDTPIRRGTRKREQVSPFMMQLLSSKRMLRDKSGNRSNGSALSIKTSSEITRVKRQQSTFVKEAEDEKEECILKPKDSQLSHSGPTSQIQKVEQWLNKNESLKVTGEASKNHKSQEMQTNICYDDDLEPTQVFQMESIHARTLVSPYGCGPKNDIDFFSIDHSLKREVPSQSSTIIFKSENIQTQNLEDITKFQDEHLAEKEKNYVDKVIVQDEVGSEKENEKVLNTDHVCHKKGGIKRVLSEPNLVRKTRKTIGKSQKAIDDAGKQDCLNKEKWLPGAAVDVELEEFTKGERKVRTAAEKASNSVGLDPRQPNSKGHNIRFAMEIKPKLLESFKPSKLMTRSKTKKSPGWSRVEGARRDLRSKHTSLNITGGELKMNAQNKVETSKLHGNSSQESVVNIEEDQSQVNGRSLSNAQIKNERFKELCSALPLKTKRSDNVTASSAGSPFSKTKTQSFPLETDEREVVNYNSFKEQDLNCANAKLSEDESSKANSDYPSKVDEKKCVSEENDCISWRVSSPEKQNLDPSKNISFDDCFPQPREKDIDIKDGKNLSFKSAEHSQGSSSISKLSRKSVKNITGVELLNSEGSAIKPSTENVAESVLIASKITSHLGEDCSLLFRSIEKKNVGELLEIGTVSSSQAKDTLKSTEKKIYLRSPEEAELTKFAFSTNISVVPFLSKGHLGHRRQIPHEQIPNASCHHFIPCELFQTMVKYSGYLTTHSLQNRCLSANDKDHNYLPPASSSFLSMPAVSTQKRSTAAPEINTDNFDPQSCSVNVGQKSCSINVCQEAESTVTDGISCVMLQSKEGLVSLLHSTSWEDNDHTDNNSAQFEQNLLGNKTGEPAKEVCTEVVNAQSSQLSGSVLQNTDHPISALIKPNNSESKFIVSKSTDDSEDCKLNPSMPSPHFSQKDEIKVNKDSPPTIESASKIPVPHILSESPVNYKRNKSCQVLNSSDSSSGDEVDDLPNPLKRRRLTSLESSPSPSKLTPQIDSEEMRDFERYDDNIWNYFKSKSENGEICVNAASPNEGERETESASKEKDDQGKALESEEDPIPSTEEVIKNIEADLSLVRSMRQKKGKALSDTESEADTVDLCTQDSILTSSTTNELSSSTRDLFRKCNLSLNLAHEILNNSSENFEGMDTAKENLSSNKSVNLNKGIGVVEEEDAGNESHSSAFSSQSLVISTQQRNKVQGEVETLRKKIFALEEEMRKKEATLDKNTNSKVEDFTQCDNQLTVAKNAENDEVGRDSDLESEELFRSFPCPVESTSGITFRDKTSKNNRNKKSVSTKPLAVICTGLNQSETAKVHSLLDTLGGNEAKLLPKWSKETTHVIVKTDAEGLTERTLKYLFGVASGAWVISLTWVIDSLNSYMLLPEDEYEALDCTGAPGPRRGRHISTSLFKGCQFCLIPPFEDVTPDQLSDLVRMAGGTIVERFSDSKPGLKLFVTSAEEPAKNAMNLAGTERRSKITVAHDWLIECIGMCCLVSLSNYIIGSPPTASEITASGIPSSLVYETQDLPFEDV